MVTSVGLSAPATCAALRAGVRNMSPTSWWLERDEPLLAAQVPLPRPWRGRTKLVKLLAASVSECLATVRSEDIAPLPILVCLAEKDRPGRPDALEDSIIAELENEIGIQFSPAHTATLSLGRVSGLVALAQARTLMVDHGVPRVLVAGVDSLLVARSLAWLEDNDRLLTPDNSNGFIPGEASGCVLLEPATTAGTQVTCVGIGLARENVTIYSDQPFRAEGLTRAVASALADAGIGLEECSLRMADLSGEHYYFREAALAISRLLRREGCRELWHPSECIGEVGAAIGPILLGYAAVAARKRFLPGRYLLVQSGSDDGSRAAACLAVTGVADGE
jgi:3-oxoacyl-[acyl-carrier-protein] synthase-1